MTGVDVDQRKVEAISQGRLRTGEPGLENLLGSTRETLRVTTDHATAVRESDATFVVVPTPSKKSGEFSLRYVKPAMEKVGASLAAKSGYHLVVLCSTVMPGSMEGAILPGLARASGRTLNEDYGVCYNPEFIALGDVIRGLRNPDFVLVGESDKRAGDVLEAIQSQVCVNQAPVERMGFINAELAKISVNAFVTMKMSFANTLAEICERLPGGDVDTITRALGRDRRIGSSYLKGAIGYGGPCFPRDNIAFAKFAGGLGVSADLAKATDRINEKQVKRILGLIEAGHRPGSSSIGILGVAYRPDTNVTDASQALMLADALARRGFEVHVYDPQVGKDQLREFSRLQVEGSASECVSKSDVCVIATPWESFEKIEKSTLSQKAVLDCWRILNGNRPADPSRYMALGKYMAGQKGLRP